MRPAREVAARIIARWVEAGVPPGHLLEEVQRDRPFVTELVYGVVRRRAQLEWLVRRYAARRPPPALAAALWIGLYQLLWLADVADYAAVNETVAAAKKLGGAKAAPFVNAVLRKVSTERDAVLKSLEQTPLPVKFSHPAALLARWRRHYGAEAAANICLWNNTPAEVAIFANTLKIAEHELEKTLRAQECLQSVLVSGGRRFFRLKRGVAVPDLPGFAEGYFAVADPAAAQAVALLAVTPGMRVLDVCAAPGGKTAMLAADLQARGELRAWEPQPARRRRLMDNLRRLGLAEFVATAPVDALAPPENIGQFERILLDVPCSNTGVIRHKPDVRWRFSAAQLRDLTHLQLRLLQNVARLLMPGGRLVYSTCSIEPEENGLLVRRWLKTVPSFVLLAEKFALPGGDNMDGFYAALLARKSLQS